MDEGLQVLVVEDDASVRRMVVRALSAAGYAVSDVGTGREALERLAERPAPRLVLTDLVLPDMRGGQLAAAARAARPGLRIVFMSGYTAGHDASQGIEAGSERFLEKPFTPQALVEKVREALDA